MTYLNAIFAAATANLKHSAEQAEDARKVWQELLDKKARPTASNSGREKVNVRV
jgi:hypothetical protein